MKIEEIASKKDLELELFLGKRKSTSGIWRHWEA